ncbi:MAG: type II secretion system GspH family protein [Ruminococcus sp.]|nr:type II secretion system GspH family protein [Ruminococcus sp.]MDE7104552.1 type II secretion system GspH family protein [Ruminococcus sp.]
MKKNKSKKFAGMTLFEIIISLAILSMLTLVLVQTSSVINMYIRSANNVNKKTSEQAPVAEVERKGNANKVDDDAEIIINYKKDGADATVALKGDAYEVIESVTDASGNIVESDPDDKSNLGGNLNMQFIVLDPVTAPPTTTTGP